MIPRVHGNYVMKTVKRIETKIYSQSRDTLSCRSQCQMHLQARGMTQSRAWKWWRTAKWVVKIRQKNVNVMFWFSTSRKQILIVFIFTYDTHVNNNIRLIRYVRKLRRQYVFLWHQVASIRCDARKRYIYRVLKKPDGTCLVYRMTSS